MGFFINTQNCLNTHRISIKDILGYQNNFNKAGVQRTKNIFYLRTQGYIVSYTVRYCLKYCIPQCWMKGNNKSCLTDNYYNPVSYTHLDVYKRQNMRNGHFYIY